MFDVEMDDAGMAVVERITQLGLLDAFVDHINQLRGAPTFLSRPSQFPMPLGYQSFQFQLGEYVCTVLFKYKTNETALYFVAINLNKVD